MKNKFTLISYNKMQPNQNLFFFLTCVIRVALTSPVFDLLLAPDFVVRLCSWKSLNLPFTTFYAYVIIRRVHVSHISIRRPKYLIQPHIKTNLVIFLEESTRLLLTFIIYGFYNESNFCVRQRLLKGCNG